MPDPRSAVKAAFANAAFFSLVILSGAREQWACSRWTRRAERRISA